MKAYENHCAKNGQPPSVSESGPKSSNPVQNPRFFLDFLGQPSLTTSLFSQHARAKEILAGLAAGEVDRLFETKGESSVQLAQSCCFGEFPADPGRRTRHVRPRGGQAIGAAPGRAGSAAKRPVLGCSVKRTSPESDERLETV